MARLKTGPKFVLAAIVIIGGIFGLRWYQQNHGTTKMQSSVPQGGELVDFKEATPQTTEKQTGPMVFPSTTEKSELPGQCIRTWIIPWNSQMGLALANGGPDTMKNRWSLAPTNSRRVRRCARPASTSSLSWVMEVRHSSMASTAHSPSWESSILRRWFSPVDAPLGRTAS